MVRPDGHADHPARVTGWLENVNDSENALGRDEAKPRRFRFPDSVYEVARRSSGE